MTPAEVFATYAAACRALRPDGITAVQVRELAGRDTGADPAALRADAAAVAAVSAVADAALSDERTAAGMLAAVWRGRSAAAACGLLEQQCATAAEVAAGTAGAVEVLTRLAGRLTRLLDAREEAGIRILDRGTGRHPAWLAAAAAVLGGTADAETVAMVRSQIAPYVDTDIAGDWAAAVTAVSDEVAAAYRDAVSALAERPGARFEAAPAVLAAAVPPRTVRPGPAPPTGSATAPAPTVAAVPPAAGAPAVDGGLAGMGGPDGLGGWSGVGADGIAAPAGTRFAALDRAGLDEQDAPPDEPEAEPEPDEPEPDEPEAEPEPDDDSASEPAPAAAAAPAVPPPPVPAAPLPAPLPAEAGFIAPTAQTPPAVLPDVPPDPEPPVPDEPTPCETAADALPQVGG